MRTNLIVDRVIPWSQYNEYEGQLDGRVDGHPVSARGTDGGWAEIHPGDVLEVDLLLVRRGAVTVVGADVAPALDQVDGIDYVMVGEVKQRDGDVVQVESVLPLEVDLVTGPRRVVPDVAVGERIRVEGSFEFERLDD